MKTLILDAVTKSISCVMSGAATTTNPDFTAHYSDSTATTFTEGANDGTLNGATPVTLVTSPAASTQRIIKSIIIQNRDTAAVTITVNYISSGGTRQIWKGTLAVNDTWTTEGVFDTSGALKTKIATIDLASPTDVTGILPIANGGTAASTASAARTSLGLGTISTQNANTVVITGGDITGITDLPIADGGTGASTAQVARNNLLPSQSGKAGLYLQSDGTDVLWNDSGAVVFSIVFGG